MAKYRVSVPVAAATAGAVLAALRAGARRMRIKQITLIATTAVQSQIGVCRPATAGTPTVSVLGQALDDNDAASTSNIDTAWSSNPTQPSPIFFERATIGNVIGNGVVWMFIEPLIVDAGQELLLMNFAASSSSAMQISVSYED